MALIAKDFSHWFVVEVELITHSFENHVLPQIRSFCYGDPQGDCVASLARSKVINEKQAETLLSFVPRSVAVIANKWNSDWHVGLNALKAQLLAISVFRSAGGDEAFEINGRLEGFGAHLGFGRYAAVDRSLIFPKDLNILDGQVQINDPEGSVSTWTVSRADQFTWVAKVAGTPDFVDGTYVQLIRTSDGGLSFRRPQQQARY